MERINSNYCLIISYLCQEIYLPGWHWCYLKGDALWRLTERDANVIAVLRSSGKVCIP